MPDFIIRNFQSIKEAKISVKGFTLLVGESSSGKSACLRAIYAATHNRFKIGQVRYGEEAATVKVRYPESDKVLTVVRRSTGSPIMKLGDEVFSKISRNVPQQVEEFNNFGVLSVSDNPYSLNFHSQFDKPLLLEFSQSKVMEILSTSKALDDLNFLHKILAEERSENRGAIGSTESILSSKNAEFSMVKYELENRKSSVELDNLINKVQSLEEVSSTLTEFSKLFFQHNSLSSKELVLDKLVKDLSDVVNFSEVKELGNTLSNLMVSLEILSKRLELLMEVIGHSKKCKDLSIDVNFGKDLIRDLRILNKSQVEIQPLQNKMKLLREALKWYDRQCQGNILKDNISNSIQLLEVYRSYLDKEHQLEDVVNNRVCPICHSKIN